MTETDRERYRVALDEVWPRVRREFNYPLINEARLSSETTGGDAYRWRDDEVVLSKPFLDRLGISDPDELHTVLETLLKHEVGHYVLFPRELVDHLTYLQRATDVFGEEYGSNYYQIYADICVDLRLVEGRYVGDELLDLLELTLQAAGTANSDVEETVQRRVHRLLVGIYQESFEGLPRRVSLTDTEESWLDPLLDIDYFTDERSEHERNIVRFGNALERVLADIPGHAVREFDSPLDEGKSGSSMPFGGHEPTAVPDAALDDALSDAIDDGGMEQYERLLSFLESRADFEDPLEPDERSGGAAGIGPGEFERHDDMVAFYRRWARNFPLYVTETDVPADDEARYRHGRRDFEADDPLHDVNPFASLGQIGVPGVTKVDRYVAAESDESRRSIPDLLVGIDSSGSMPTPAEESHAVLAAFVLAATYRRNGAHVGGYNFSTEVAFLPPTSDISELYSLACGYWGGGTLFDRETLADFVTNADQLDGIAFSSTEEYERLLASIEDTDGPPSGSNEFLGDDLAALDHVLITDGEILNEQSLVDHINGVSDRVRTFVFVTDAATASEWAERDIDARVYGADDADDLVDIVLDVARERLPDG